jgi:hypothetical protein
VTELGVLDCARRPSSPCLVSSATSGFGGADVVGAGSGSDGSSDDGPSGGGASGGGASDGENADGGPHTDDGPRTVECMLSDVQGICLLNEDTSSSFTRQTGPQVTGRHRQVAALESVQAVIARLEGKVEESMETRSEDIFNARDVAPVVVQRRNDQQSCRIFDRRGFVEKTSRS